MNKELYDSVLLSIEGASYADLIMTLEGINQAEDLDTFDEDEINDIATLIADVAEQVYEEEEARKSVDFDDLYLSLAHWTELSKRDFEGVSEDELAKASNFLKTLPNCVETCATYELSCSIEQALDSLRTGE